MFELQIQKTAEWVIRFWRRHQRLLRRSGDIIGVDLVEVAPDYDLTGSTATLAAQLLLNLIGRIHHNRINNAGK